MLRLNWQQVGKRKHRAEVAGLCVWLKRKRRIFLRQGFIWNVSCEGLQDQTDRDFEFWRIDERAAQAQTEKVLLAKCYWHIRTIEQYLHKPAPNMMWWYEDDYGTLYRWIGRFVLHPGDRPSLRLLLSKLLILKGILMPPRIDFLNIRATQKDEPCQSTDDRESFL